MDVRLGLQVNRRRSFHQDCEQQFHLPLRVCRAPHGTNCLSMSSPWMWSNETNTFYQDDAKAFTWAQANHVSEPLYVKWDFCQPTVSTTAIRSLSQPIRRRRGMERLSEPGFTGGSQLPGTRCGDVWNLARRRVHQRCMGKLRASLYRLFPILEDPAVPPGVNVSVNTLLRTRCLAAGLATDNTYLDHVILYWDDGTEHHVDWNG